MPEADRESSASTDATSRAHPVPMAIRVGAPGLVELVDGPIMRADSGTHEEK